MSTLDVASIVAKWESVGNEALCIARDGVAAADLDAFEGAHRIVLPRAFRELYTRSDGTGSMDADEIIFWPLDAIADALAVNSQVGDGALWVMFADWRLSARVFMLRFAPTSSAPSLEAFDAFPPAPTFLEQVTSIAPSIDAFLFAVSRRTHVAGSRSKEPRVTPGAPPASW